jgi:hypothetical protein
MAYDNGDKGQPSDSQGLRRSTVSYYAGRRREPLVKPFAAKPASPGARAASPVPAIESEYDLVGVSSDEETIDDFPPEMPGALRLERLAITPDDEPAEDILVPQRRELQRFLDAISAKLTNNPSLYGALKDTDLQLEELGALRETIYLHQPKVNGTGKKQHLILLTDFIFYLENIFEKFQRIGNPGLPNLCFDLIFAYSNLDFYKSSLIDPRVRKLARATKLRNAVTTGALKEETTSHTYIGTLESLLQEFCTKFLGIEMIHAFMRQHAGILPLRQAIFRLPDDAKQAEELVRTEYLSKEKLPTHFTSIIQRVFNDHIRLNYREYADSKYTLSINLQAMLPLAADNIFTIALLGCHGMNASYISRAKAVITSIDTVQNDVAAQIKKKNCDMVMQLGDNAYYDGVEHCVTQSLNGFFPTNFRKYGWRNNLSVMPSFVVAGNHDVGLWCKGDFTSPLQPTLHTQSALERELNLVLHTYTNNDHWNMPYRYYLLQHEHFVIIALDTNMLITDPDQQEWFVNTVKRIKAEFPRKWIIVTGHHPLIYLGKRAAEPCEWRIYLQDRKPVFYHRDGNPRDIPLSEDTSEPHYYNTIGKFCLALIQEHDLSIDLWTAAHEHFMAAVNIVLPKGKEIKQLTSGAGGAELKTIKYSYTQGNFPSVRKESASQKAQPSYELFKSVDVPFWAAVPGFIQLQIKPNEICYKPVTPVKPDDPRSFVTDNLGELESSKIPQRYSRIGPQIYRQFNVLLRRSV